MANTVSAEQKNSFSTRFNKARLAAKMDIATIARELKVSTQSAYAWANGSIPRIDRINELAKLFSVDPGWLAYGYEPETISDEAEREIQKAIERENVRRVDYYSEPPEDGWTRVPILDLCGSCGPDPTETPQGDEIIGEADFSNRFLRSLPGVISVNDNFAIITTKGDSMEPTIKRSGFCLVDRHQCDINLDGIFCLYAENSLYVKRIQLNLDRSLTLLSDNPHYPPQKIDRSLLDSATVVGRVVYIFNGSIA